MNNQQRHRPIVLLSFFCPYNHIMKINLCLLWFIFLHFKQKRRLQANNRQFWHQCIAKSQVLLYSTLFSVIKFHLFTGSWQGRND